MAGKFVELQEAAKLLGLSPDELIEKRSSGDIHGYRDGASWKFKMQEIERFADEQGISLGGGASAVGGAAESPADDLLAEEDQNHDFGSLLDEVGLDEDLKLDEEDEEGGSSILVDEQQAEDESTTSTIIGAGNAEELNLHDEGSDLKLADEDAGDLELDDDASDLKLADDADGALQLNEEASDLNLADEGSALSLNDDGLDLGDDSELQLAAENEQGAEPAGGSDVLSDAGSELKLATGSGTGDLSDALADDVDDLDLGSDVDLALSEDDDLVLGASGTGSDVTLDAEGSGINLASPTDSGLSLEDEPLELGGSDVGSSLELPEDDDFISLDSVADPDEATQLKQDEEFLLSPSDDLEIEGEDSDSGSQVIALEDSEAFDQDAATMLQPTEGEPAAEGQDLGDQAFPAAAVAGGAAAGAATVPGAMPGAVPQSTGAPAAMVPAQIPEASYSIWNVLSLMVIVLILALGGMLMTDLIRNMWSWEGDYAATTSIMDGIVDMLGFNN